MQLRSHNFRRRVVLLLAATVAPVAGGEAQAQEIVTVAGEDRWIEVDFEEVYRVGSADGEVWQEFGTLRQVAFDAAGNLYVLDSLAGRVVVVAAGGELLREFGRLGEGPGSSGTRLRWRSWPMAGS